jgi:hypothetical protein
MRSGNYQIFFPLIFNRLKTGTTTVPRKGRWGTVLGKKMRAVEKWYL